jgi:thiol-disulfide isomerase/thioredoxin
VQSGCQQLHTTPPPRRHDDEARRETYVLLLVPVALSRMVRGIESDISIAEKGPTADDGSYLLLPTRPSPLSRTVPLRRCNKSISRAALIVQALFIFTSVVPLTMMNSVAQTLLLALVAVLASTEAFAPVAFSSRRMGSLPMAVVDIDGESAFDKTIKSAGSSLVIVDYSTTWCGPCKVIAPKFDEFSEKYPDAVFLKVRSCFLAFSWCLCNPICPSCQLTKFVFCSFLLYSR